MKSDKIESYKDLIAWQKSMDLVETIYQMTKKFPAEERFGLFSQMRRSAVSIPSNIAEGYRRSGRGDYIKFVRYAFGSGSELETQIEIVHRLKLAPKEMITHSKELCEEVMKIINGLLWKLERKVP